MQRGSIPGRVSVSNYSGQKEHYETQRTQRNDTSLCSLVKATMEAKNHNDYGVFFSLYLSCPSCFSVSFVLLKSLDSYFRDIYLLNILKYYKGQ